MNSFIGQLLLAAWDRAPNGFAQCNGQTLSISANQALFSLLGTQFGGNGINTFALPNLQGRTPVGAGPSFVLGQIGGSEGHVLTANEVPGHTHQLYGSPNADSDLASNALIAGNGANVFTAAANLSAMNGATIGTGGGSQPHENRQPFLVMNWCIALQGIYPSRP